MNVLEYYCRKNPVVHKTNFDPLTALIVIIPVLDDEAISDTIASLGQCHAPDAPVGVVILVNNAENCDGQVRQRNRELAVRIKKQVQAFSGGWLQFEVLEELALPAKFAGVGLARKIAMDTVADHYYRMEKTDGVIISLDADTLVASDYFVRIQDCFRGKRLAGVSIAYEHLLEGPGNQPEMTDAIVKYELYLRYHRQALAYTGHPHAFHCIGSAFAVSVEDYAAQGGMNKRQAGEDFYFLQKLISTGRYATLGGTKVYPSPRISSRTPFGTGQAVRQIIENEGVYNVYHFDAYRRIKKIFGQLDLLYKTSPESVGEVVSGLSDPGLSSFLNECRFTELVGGVNANSASLPMFKKRFFDSFNAFRVLKCLNYLHSGYLEKQEISCAVNALLEEQGVKIPSNADVRELLMFLRRSDA